MTAIEADLSAVSISLQCGDVDRQLLDAQFMEQTDALLREVASRFNASFTSPYGDCSLFYISLHCPSRNAHITCSGHQHAYKHRYTGLYELFGQRGHSHTKPHIMVLSNTKPKKMIFFIFTIFSPFSMKRIKVSKPARLSLSWYSDDFHSTLSQYAAGRYNPPPPVASP